MTFPSMIPSLPPPPGEASDFGHPSPLLKWNIVCTVVCLSITTITFVLRLWVRLGVLQQWILEDCMFLLLQSLLSKF